MRPGIELDRGGRKQLALLAFVLLLASGGRAAALSTRTVVLSGDPAPGTAGAVFHTFQPPVLNAHGETAFGALLASGDVTAANDQGIWHSDATGSLSRIVREGDVSSEAGPFGSIRPFPALNDLSQLAFGSGIAAGEEGRFWVAEPGTEPVLFASENAPADGLASGVLIDQFENADPRFSNAGVPVFEASTTSTFSVPGSQAVFGPGAGERSNALVLLGDAIAGGTIQTFETRAQRVDDAGRVILGARLDTGGPAWLQAVLLTTPDGGLEARIVEGDPAPGIPNAVFAADFRNAFTSYRSNVVGQVAVAASVRVDAQHDGGIWILEPGGGGALLLRNRDPISGTTPSQSIVSLQSAQISFNDVGQVAFLTSVEDPAPVYRKAVVGPTSDGDFALLATAGQPAFGISGGVTYQDFRRPTLNDRGETAFLATLSGIPGVPLGAAIYLADTAGALTLVVGSGSELEVAPGDARTVTTVNFPDGDFAARGQSGLNDSGQVAFLAGFDDGSSGIFVTTVPEPSAPVLATCALVAVAFVRRSRARAERGRRRARAASPEAPSHRASRPPAGA
jgi:hypothetical protein